MKFKDRKSCKKVLMRVKGRALERNKPRDISDTRENHDLRNNPFRDTINYNFGFGAGRVVYDVAFQNTIESTSGPTIVILIAFSVFFSAFSLFLTIKALFKSFSVYRFAKSQLQEGKPSWDEFSFKDKCAFFNLWCSILLLPPNSLGILFR